MYIYMYVHCVCMNARYVYMHVCSTYVRRHVFLYICEHTVGLNIMQASMCVSMYVYMYVCRGRDSSVGIATGYELDDQEEREFESR
jgi:hypothetical protein